RARSKTRKLERRGGPQPKCLEQESEDQFEETHVQFMQRGLHLAKNCFAQSERVWLMNRLRDDSHNLSREYTGQITGLLQPIVHHSFHHYPGPAAHAVCGHLAQIGRRIFLDECMFRFLLSTVAVSHTQAPPAASHPRL